MTLKKNKALSTRSLYFCASVAVAVLSLVLPIFSKQPWHFKNVDTTLLADAALLFLYTLATPALCAALTTAFYKSFKNESRTASGSITFAITVLLIHAMQIAFATHLSDYFAKGATLPFYAYIPRVDLFSAPWLLSVAFFTLGAATAASLGRFLRKRNNSTAPSFPVLLQAVGATTVLGAAMILTLERETLPIAASCAAASIASLCAIRFSMGKRSALFLLLACGTPYAAAIIAATLTAAPFSSESIQAALLSIITTPGVLAATLPALVQALVAFSLVRLFDQPEQSCPLHAPSVIMIALTALAATVALVGSALVPIPFHLTIKIGLITLFSVFFGGVLVLNVLWPLRAARRAAQQPLRHDIDISRNKNASISRTTKPQAHDA